MAFSISVGTLLLLTCPRLLLCTVPFLGEPIYYFQVLATKDWTKWDWDVVDDIVQDVLPHSPRLVDALRTKWIKRVSGFYRFVGASGTSTER